MRQTFPPVANVIAKASVVAVVVLLAVVGGAVDYFVRSSWMTGTNVAVSQPVPFSHLHHVRQLGIDCRYCHTSVEESAYANIPPTETCMSCHSQIWTQSPMLEPVRASWQTGQPIPWNKVHDLADFVYFNHSAHVNNGIGCESCHGRVDNMPLAWKANTLHMEWCLECHRNPEVNVRPPDEIYTMGYNGLVASAEGGEGEGEAEALEAIDGHALVAEYGIEVGRLDNCSICHR